MFDIEEAYLDVETIEKGKWIPLGADFPGVAIQARGMSSKEAKVYLDRLRRELPRTERLADGSIPEEVNERIITKVIVEKCLFNWRGFGAGGKELAYSKTTAEGFMTEPKARKIGQAIVGAIIAIDNTKARKAEEVSGN